MKYFKLEEFTCKCGCGQAKMNQRFLEKLDALREDFGAPLLVTSGYRCPEYNQRVSNTGPDGPHTTGHAADLAVRGPLAMELLEAALVRGGFTGVGLNQKGTARFVHLDDLPNEPNRPRPTIWTY